MSDLPKKYLYYGHTGNNTNNGTTYALRKLHPSAFTTFIGAGFAPVFCEEATHTGAGLTSIGNCACTQNSGSITAPTGLPIVPYDLITDDNDVFFEVGSYNSVTGAIVLSSTTVNAAPKNQVWVKTTGTYAMSYITPVLETRTQAQLNFNTAVDGLSPCSTLHYSGCTGGDATAPTLNGVTCFRYSAVLAMGGLEKYKYFGLRIMSRASGFVSTNAPGDFFENYKLVFASLLFGVGNQGRVLNRCSISFPSSSNASNSNSMTVNNTTIVTEDIAFVLPAHSTGCTFSNCFIYTPIFTNVLTIASYKGVITFIGCTIIKYNGGTYAAITGATTYNLKNGTILPNTLSFSNTLLTFGCFISYDKTMGSNKNKTIYSKMGTVLENLGDSNFTVLGGISCTEIFYNAGGILAPASRNIGILSLQQYLINKPVKVFLDAGTYTFYTKYNNYITGLTGNNFYMQVVCDAECLLGESGTDAIAVRAGIADWSNEISATFTLATAQNVEMRIFGSWYDAANRLAFGYAEYSPDGGTTRIPFKQVWVDGKVAYSMAQKTTTADKIETAVKVTVDGKIITGTLSASGGNNLIGSRYKRGL